VTITRKIHLVPQSNNPRRCQGDRATRQRLPEEHLQRRRPALRKSLPTPQAQQRPMLGPRQQLRQPLMEVAQHQHQMPPQTLLQMEVRQTLNLQSFDNTLKYNYTDLEESRTNSLLSDVST
jgi:hypothetical protein